MTDRIDPPGDTPGDGPMIDILCMLAAIDGKECGGSLQGRLAIEWEPSEAHEPLEREVKVSIGRADESDHIVLFMGESDARQLGDLLARFFGSQPTHAEWKARN